MSIRSINLDNAMRDVLRGIRRDLLPRNMQQGITSGECVDPARVDEVSRRALLKGIDAFCDTFPTLLQITTATKEYETALSFSVKESRILLDITTFFTAIIGSVISILPGLLPRRQIHDQFSEELRQKHSAQWGIVWAGATLATVASLRVFASLCLTDKEVTNRSRLNRLWTQLDGRVPEGLLEARDNLRHQFENHCLTYVYLCKRFNLERPERLTNIAKLYSPQ